MAGENSTIEPPTLQLTESFLATAMTHRVDQLLYRELTADTEANREGGTAANSSYTVTEIQLTPQSFA